MQAKQVKEIKRKLEAMKVVELKAIAEGADIPIAGKKQDLIDRILETIVAGGLWIPGLDDVGTPLGLVLPARQEPQFSVKVQRIMQAKAEGREP